MSLKFTFSDEQLRQPRIFEAVQRFLGAIAVLRLEPSPPAAAPLYAPAFGAATPAFVAATPAVELPQGGRRGRKGEVDLPPVLPATPSPPRPAYVPKPRPAPVVKLPKVKPPKPPRPVKVKTPRPAPVRRPPVPKVKPVPEVMDFPEFEASLPTNSRKFIALVRSKGIVRVADVIEHLELDTPKAVGGITGAISRWAPLRGVVVPYDTLYHNGERIWRWHGVELPEDEPRRRSEVREEPKRKLLTLDEVIEKLSEPARKLLLAVRDAGSLGIADAVAITGVPRAGALSGVVAEIREISDANELRVLEDTVDMRGSRLFRWHAPTPAASSPTPAEDSDKEYATDGVIRRRRKVT